MKKKSLKDRAIHLLARREHSEKELITKLVKAGFELDDVQGIVTELKQAGLQSDQRFTENFIHYRSQRGMGSQRIQQELKERGVHTDIIDQALAESDIDWFLLAQQVRCKRFGEHVPQDYKNRAKQQRFLQYRGFTHEQIIESFNTDIL